MRALEEKILKEGTVLPGNILKVGSFLNHQIDVDFIMEMGKESDSICFKELPATKVLSIYHCGSYDHMEQAYSSILKYARENGYKITGLPRESYIDGIWNKEKEEDWLTEIQVPIQ